MLLFRKKVSETALFSYNRLNCYTCVCSYYQVIQVYTFVVEVLYQMFMRFLQVLYDVHPGQTVFKHRPRLSVTLCKKEYGKNP